MNQKHLLSMAATFTLAATTSVALAADIPVGSVAAVTGPVAEIAAKIVAARNLAAQHINEQGGLFGGDSLKLVLADAQCDAKAGVDAGNKVINVEQVVAILGPNCSGATNGLVQAVSIPAGVVAISDAATAPSISELEDNDLVFRVAPSDAYQGRALAELAINSGYKKVAMTYSNDDYNAGLAAVFEKAYQELGGDITANQAHEPNKASYRAEVTTLANGDPEALAVFAYYGGSGIAIIRNSLEAGMFDKFIGADGMLDGAVIEQIGADNLRGNIMVTTAASDDSTASYKAFADAFSAVGGDLAAPFVGHGYDVTFLIALAIEKAGSADRSKISASLREVANAPGEVVRPGEWAKAKALIAEGKDINYEGASGAIEFDENGDVAGLYSVSTVNDAGEWEARLLK